MTRLDWVQLDNGVMIRGSQVKAMRVLQNVGDEFVLQAQVAQSGLPPTWLNVKGEVYKNKDAAQRAMELLANTL